MGCASCYHRDVKPGNILIRRSRSGKVKAVLTDAGIAKDGIHLGNLEGTPGFSSSYFTGYDCSDVYSLGIVVSFLLMEEDCFWQGNFKAQKDETNRNHFVSSSRFHKEVTEIVEKFTGKYERPTLLVKSIYLSPQCYEFFKARSNCCFCYPTAFLRMSRIHSQQWHNIFSKWSLSESNFFFSTYSDVILSADHENGC